MGNVHEAIEQGQVDDQTPRPRGLPNHKPVAGKAGRGKRSKLHRTLGNQRQGDLPKSSPFDGSRGIRRHGDEFRRQRRRPEEGYAIPLPEDLHHPRNRARPSRPASGGTDSHRTGLGKAMAPTSGNPKVSTKSGTEVLTPCRQKEEWQVWVCDGGTLSECGCTKGE